MKRILALFIAVILVFPCFSINAQENVEINDEFSDMTELLKITGIFKADEEIADKEITRGDFAAYLVKLKGIGEHFGEYEGYSFADVDSSVANYHEIYAAKDMGLINGYSDGTFRPENTVSVMEAAVCMTRVLGYNVKAEGLGGYPTGYYTVINELRLMEGVKATYNENLSFNDFVQLVFNALHTNVMAATSFGDDPGYEVKSGVTLLKSSFGISYIDGIVSAIDITSLFGDNNVSPYHAVIGDETFCVGNYNIEPMLGYNVRAYYKMEDSKEMVKLAIKSSNFA